MKSLTDDNQLVARMAAGDQSAFAQLVERHLNDLVAFVERMTDNRADAEDIAQESFARAWQQAKNWNAGKAKYRTWLFQVAMNQLRDCRRRQRPTGQLDETIVCSRSNPEQATDTAAQAVRVRLALQALPERQRGAMILCHYHGMTNIETAQTLSISVEAVESLLGRARRTLRETLVAEKEVSI